MKSRLFFLFLFATLIAPGLASAQSTVVFAVDVAYPGLSDAQGPDVEAALNCNTGIPMVQTATVGDYKYGGTVTFTVSDVPYDFEVSCEVSFGDFPSGFQLDHVNYWSDYDGDSGYSEEDVVCTFGGETDVDVGLYNECRLALMPAPFDFVVEVNWDISDEHDVGVGGYAQVELECVDLYQKKGRPSSESITLDAGPGYTGPLALTNLLPDPKGFYEESSDVPTTCYARLLNFGSAVEAVSECWDDGVVVDLDNLNPTCTITATAFYEGVPTLGSLGRAVMVLLVLGVGLIGIRRIV